MSPEEAVAIADPATTLAREGGRFWNRAYLTTVGEQATLGWASVREMTP